MALKTDYKAFIAPETGRRFHQTPNSDGTVTITDVTVYTQEGDYYGPEALNTTNAKVNEIDSALNTTNAKVNEIDSALATRAILGVGAGAHNSIYGGRFLGNAVTGEQYAAINGGTFEDLYIGDYWTINNVVYRIAAFDYYLTTGDTSCEAHHVTLVPDASMYTHVMNDTSITTGAYIGSKMYTEGLNSAKTTIQTAFGAAHVLTHRQYLKNAVTDEYESGASWYDSSVELMTEQNCYGGKVLGNIMNGVAFPASYTIDKSQYPLFAFRPDMITNRQSYWLRDVVSASNFALANAGGHASSVGASGARGVRPAFSIYQS